MTWSYVLKFQSHEIGLPNFLCEVALENPSELNPIKQGMIQE